MIAFGRRETSQATRRDLQLRDGHVGAKSEWMDTGKDSRLSPTVFLIEQPPNATISAHFHHNNQFQVFVAGSGKIGARTLEPVTVHYAGAYTGYGPLVAGDEGLQYFTIRTVYETGAIRVADSEGRWPKGPRRHATSKPVELFDDLRLRTLSAPATTVVLPVAEDGLASSTVALPPGGSMPPVDIGVGEGVFLLVLAGDVVADGQQLDRHESLYVSNGEPFPAIIAGDGGAQLVAMIPPKRDPAYS